MPDHIPVPPPTPPVPPVPPAPLVPPTPPLVPSTPPAPVAPLVPMASSNSTTMAIPQPVHKSVAVFVTVVGALVVLGGIAFAGYQGVIPIPFLAKQPTLKEAVSKLSGLSSSRVALKAHVAMQPKEEKTPVISLKESEQENAGSMALIARSMMSSLPADAVLDISTSGDWARNKELAETESSFEGTYTAGGLSLSLATDVRAVGGYTYVHPTILPSLIVDFSGIIGKWIKFKDLSSISLSGGSEILKTDWGGSTKSEEPKEEKKPEPFGNVVAEVNLLLEKGEQNGAFLVSAIDSKAEVEGRSAWKMTLAFDPAKYREAFKAAHAERATALPGRTDYVLLTDDALKSLEDPAAQTRMDAFSSALTFTLYVDKKTRNPVMIAVDGTFALDSQELTSFKDRQMHLTTAISLSKQNETVTVVAPEETISPREAVGIMSGVPKEEILFEQQTQNVSDLRDALRAYKEKHGQFPATLDGLIGFTWPDAEDEKTSEDDDFIGLGLSPMRRTVIGVGLDVHTGKPFEYAVTPTGFTLLYQMRLAGVTDGTDAYVEGVNTATPAFVSAEGNDPALKAARESARVAALQSGPDGDGDGLTDAYEAELGTDPKSKDSDGDGYGDKQELDAGYNPAGMPTTSLGLARMKSRDSRRVADIKQIQTALELYYMDTPRGTYPPAPVGGILGKNGAGKLCGDGWKKIGEECAEVTYMGLISGAPTPFDNTCSSADNEYRYTASADGSSYTLTFCTGGEVGDLKQGKHVATMDGIDASPSASAPITTSFASATPLVSAPPVVPEVRADECGMANLTYVGQSDPLDCIEKNFRACSPANFATSMGAMSAGYDIRSIVGPEGDYCKVTVNAYKNADASIQGKTMTCLYDNRLSYKDALAEQSTYTRCSGPLKDALKKAAATKQ